jgi:hypothetical protein
MRVENFCRAEEPDAYLFLQQLTSFFAHLDGGFVLTAPPLPDVTPIVQQLSALYTTTPPLANLAYGASAPEGGSLVGVTPRLTTFTSGGETVTSLVTWVPEVKGSTYDTPQASRSAAGQVGSVLGASFATGGQGTSTGQGQGEGVGPARSTMCYGRGPCDWGVGREVPVGFVGLSLVLTMALGLFVT